MTIDEIEKRIRDAIAKVQADGVEIVTGLWSVIFEESRWKTVHKRAQCCALGALLVSENPKPAGDYGSEVATAAHTLGVTVQWVDSFIAGFDDAQHIGNGWRSYMVIRSPEAQELGWKLRAEFVSVR